MSEKKTVLSDFKDENTEGEYRFVLKTNLISHDLFFKFLFCEKDFAVAFLRKQLPPRFASRLDFANLIVESPNFLDEQFHEQRADVIFQIPFFTEDPDEEETVESVRIFVVLEHKSYYDHYTVFQLTKYVVSIMDRSFHQKKEKEEAKKKTRKGKDVKIPPVIP
ncbi:MAG: Rpn family recombination-promoting nuclease/putative transposase, partial [Planctomycetia bacterium]|nr:Rpn family recombination-promoting nuclease/putative transposase [Planctomycetia bacterium]